MSTTTEKPIKTAHSLQFPVGIVEQGFDPAHIHICQAGGLCVAKIPASQGAADRARANHFVETVNNHARLDAANKRLREALFACTIQMEAARMCIVNFADETGKANDYETNLVRDALVAVGDEARAVLAEK